jgi:hypothetical protein
MEVSGQASQSDVIAIWMALALRYRELRVLSAEYCTVMYQIQV